MASHMVFVDLDGVLVDFDAGVKRLFGGTAPEELDPRRMWPVLAKTSGFYAGLPWMHDGALLWNHIKHLPPIILTGLPRGKWAEPQKREWCARELGAGFQVLTCLSKEKALTASAYVTQDCTPILIDDRLSIQESWEALGGIFILHRSAEESIASLVELGITPKTARN